ncbi:MAG: hypothetical protein OZSIB_3700 [Candidatus Ozemobacter sibiricus]|uniref:Uncharacterized protein n=1 Tax=Candidatus Ozemobacter sibiricus TaxID=2268124 RepID=A0A367ZD10_9BACT|nr:MAG: hypothetical protein OZSIB_3700 [Candidatus Ozemobacter sibiricus]
MRILSCLVILCLSFAPVAMAVTADEIVAHFEENQNWTKCAMAAFKVLKKASDPRIADMYEFVSDKTYDYEGLIIDGSEYQNAERGPLDGLLSVINDGVLAVIHKLATDEHKKLFKPTWLGFHTPTDKKVSNWFCLIMGNHTKTYLTRVDQRAKLDEIGADPLQMNLLDKRWFTFQVVKDLGNRAVLKVLPKSGAPVNVKEATIEVARLQVGEAVTWYVTKISGTLNTGSSGVTEFGDFRVAAAVPGKQYIGWSNDGKQIGEVPVYGLGQIQRQNVKPDQKLFVFATRLDTTTYQTSREVKDYEVKLVTSIQRIHINPPLQVVAEYIQPQRLATLTKVARKIVAGH